MEIPETLVRAFLAAESVRQAESVCDPKQAAAVLWPLVGPREEEVLAVMALNKRRRLVEAAILTVGTASYTIVDPRQVFRWALTRDVAVDAIILAHNHPTGDPTPSSQDRDVTQRVLSAGRVLGITVLDHLILTPDPGTWRSMNAESDVVFAAPWDGANIPILT